MNRSAINAAYREAIDPNIARFPGIEEDEAPLIRLISEPSKADQ